MSVRDYPEHLNPFGDNYLGVPGPEADLQLNRKEKYSTWSANRGNNVTLAKPKTHFLEKPWTALNMSPKGKIVRRLSILKQAVQQLATRARPERRMPRSHSVGDDFAFRIISPKLKEKLRQQAFNRELTDGNAPKTGSDTTEDTSDKPTSPQANGPLTPLRLEPAGQTDACELSPTTPETAAEPRLLGARPKTRKKKPPPPPPPTPPVRSSRSQLLELQSGEDNQSMNSSITQDLERGFSSEEEAENTGFLKD